MRKTTVDIRLINMKISTCGFCRNPDIMPHLANRCTSVQSMSCQLPPYASKHRGNQLLLLILRRLVCRRLGIGASQPFEHFLDLAWQGSIIELLCPFDKLNHALFVDHICRWPIAQLRMDPHLESQTIRRADGQRRIHQYWEIHFIRGNASIFQQEPKTCLTTWYVAKAALLIEEFRDCIRRKFHGFWFVVKVNMPEFIGGNDLRVVCQLLYKPE